MSDFTKPKTPPYLRLDGVINHTDENWVIQTPEGEQIVRPGDAVVTVARIIPRELQL